MGLELQIQQKLSPIRDPIRAFLKSGLKAAPKIRRIYSKIHIYALNLFRLSASHFLCACLGQDKISTFSLFVSPPHPAPVFQQFYSCFMTQGLGGGGVQQVYCARCLSTMANFTSLSNLALSAQFTVLGEKE